MKFVWLIYISFNEVGRVLDFFKEGVFRNVIF